MVCCDTYVTDDSGTGIVHQAPAYGEDDFRVSLAHGVLQKGEAPPDATDENGRFLPGYPWAGKTVKEADKDIILAIKARILECCSPQQSPVFVILHEHAYIRLGSAHGVLASLTFLSHCAVIPARRRWAAWWTTRP